MSAGGVCWLLDQFLRCRCLAVILSPADGPEDVLIQMIGLKHGLQGRLSVPRSRLVPLTRQNTFMATRGGLDMGEVELLSEEIRECLAAIWSPTFPGTDSEVVGWNAWMLGTAWALRPAGQP